MTKRCFHFGLSLLLLFLSLPQSEFVYADTTVPPGFTDSQVGPNIQNPTAIAFTPDGRMLVTGQSGKFYVFNQNGMALAPTVDIGSKLCTNWERGLLGVVVDPNYATNQYIYLYYTYRRYNNPSDLTNSGCEVTGGTGGINNLPLDDTTLPVNRVVRSPSSTSTSVLNLISEVVILDNIPNPGGYHNAGDLHFGVDGLLYISTGEGNQKTWARNKALLAGKILRINPHSTDPIPPSNPFVGQANAQSCGDADGSNNIGPCLEVFAFGLRNPFRFNFKPGTNEFFVNDTGWNTWEEINVGQAGADYGWPCREGSAPPPNYTLPAACIPTPPNLVDPIFKYPHDVIPGTTSTVCTAITGGAFVPANIWPGYNGAYVFADYVCNELFIIKPDGNGGYIAGDFAKGASTIDGPTHLTFGPYQNTQALYYAIRGSPQADHIRRIVYIAGPMAQLSASPLYGPINQLVTFSAVGSSDPNNEALRFDWMFGDGAVLTNITAMTVTHTYTQAGIFTATLIARNTSGAVSPPSQVIIRIGSQPPIPTIQSPATNGPFQVSETINLVGSATDIDAFDPPTKLKLEWDVLLHHLTSISVGNEHTHPIYQTSPITSTTGTITGNFVMPAPEDMYATQGSFVEIRLTATDSFGLSTTITRAIQPKRVPLTFITNPANLSYSVWGAPFTSTQIITSWAGFGLEIKTPLSQYAMNNYWIFTNWSHGGTATQILITPNNSITYTANFVSAQPVWLPIIKR